MTFLCCRQEVEIVQNEKQYCDSMKELIIMNDHQSILSNFISLEDIDKERLIDFISNYSNKIKREKIRFNDYQVSERVGSEMKVTSYGYRWASKENHTLYIIEVAISSKKDKYFIEKLMFVSFDEEIESLKFPGGFVNMNEVPPPVPS